ncbi:MAG: hypothetical protein JEZ11_17615 [Desulfobacterales bacterium]|nr:hypothetical protein [Desulfobacterales bacterium]
MKIDADGGKYGGKTDLEEKKKGLRKFRNPLILFVAGATRLELATSGVTGRYIQ